MRWLSHLPVRSVLLRYGAEVSTGHPHPWWQIKGSLCWLNRILNWTLSLLCQREVARLCRDGGIQKFASLAEKRWVRRDKRSGFLIIFFRTIDNRPYGSLNIYAVVSFVRILVGTSIARPILLMMNRISPPQAVPLSLTREALLVKTAFSLKIYRLPLLQAELAALPSEVIKNNKVFTKIVEYGNIFLSFGSEELFWKTDRRLALWHIEGNAL